MTPLRQHRWLTGVAGLNAVAPWAGSVGLIGGGLSFGKDLDERLPFGNLQLAGIALAVLVALPLTVLAWLAAHHRRGTSRWAAGCGAILIGWIAIQLVFLRALSWFHPTYLAIGAWLLIWGLHDRRRIARPRSPQWVGHTRTRP